MNILVTGGTTFVSRYTAEYFAECGHTVYVLNRGNKRQSDGVLSIKADRHALGNVLSSYQFDAVLDITAYTATDISDLLGALGDFDQYIMVSSSAVYPETLSQPFREEQPCGKNIHWGEYGTQKIEAEEELLKKVPDAYIIRPPYLYGPMNNLYREAFVFDCAEQGRPFYFPGDGSMQMQFFHVRDLCRFMEILLEERPAEHIFNVGNSDTVDIREWVRLCYAVVGKTPSFVSVDPSISARTYFPFRDYQYVLDVTKHNKLMPCEIPLSEGLAESYAWYKDHRDNVLRKDYFSVIEEIL